MWKIALFGLISGQDLKNQAAHSHQEFPGIPPPPPPGHKPNLTQQEEPFFHLLDFGILEKDTPGIAQDLCGACTACWWEIILNPGLIVVPFVHQAQLKRCQPLEI